MGQLCDVAMDAAIAGGSDPGAWLELTVSHSNNSEEFAFPSASHFTEDRNNWK